MTPEAIQAALRQGVAHQQAGRLREAEQVYRQILARHPDEPNATHMLGRIALAAGHVPQALALLGKAVSAAPHVAEWQCVLAEALQSAGRREDALRTWRRALKTRPGDPGATLALNSALVSAGRMEDAVEVCESALRAHPGRADIVAARANALEHAGRSQEAFAAVRPLMDENPPPASAAHLAARLAARWASEAEGLGWIERALAGTDVSPTWRAALLFARADLLARGADAKAAFQAYEEANRAVASGWEPQLHRRYIDLLIETFPAEWSGRIARASSRAEEIVFIVGMPRSGTSLVEQIIATHPEAFGAGELPDLRRIAKLDLPQALKAAQAWPRCAEAATAAALEEIASRHRGVLRRMAQEAGRPVARVITDKMPSNTLLLGLAAQLFPGARVVHCRRDPVDTCLSCYFTHFASGNPFTTDLAHLGDYHRQKERLMAHWGRVLDLPMLEVAYERLVAEPETEVRRLLEFCGLPWHEACLRHHESDRYVATASYAQVRQPIYRDAGSKYRAYEPFIGALREALDGASDAG